MKRSQKHRQGPPPIQVTVSHEGRDRVAGPFRRSFQIGRDDDCDVTLPITEVSRHHAEIRYEDGSWWLLDLGSSNGTFFDGEKIEKHPIEGTETFRFAADGPLVRFALVEGFKPDSVTTKRSVPSGPSGPDDSSVEAYAAHYLNEKSERPAGMHTMMIRRAFKTVQAEQKKQFSRVLVSVLVGAVVIIGIVLVLLYVSEQKRKAAEANLASMFDQIKEMELAVAEFRASSDVAENPQQAAGLARAEEQLRALNENYEATIVEYGIRRKLTPEERLIHRMALVFRESELEIPPGFVREVKDMIHGFWLRPANVRTFQESVRRAEQEDYTSFIVQQLRRNGLPAEFFYLGLQESTLDPKSVASINTRWGWAKGMWQFIPATAQRYDLAVGPLWEDDVYDPQDERQDFEKSTVAAAEYISEIYRTLAQASGLLVLASYNWGEFGVRNKLEALPDPEPFQGMDMNTASRSYWRFYNEYEDKIPDQTRDYVLKIFSLAVIGSDPRFFGIEMDDPLAPYRQGSVLSGPVASVQKP